MDGHILLSSRFLDVKIIMPVSLVIKREKLDIEILLI